MPRTTKKYTEVMSTVMPPGTENRIDALKPSYVSRSAFIRELLSKALDMEEAGKARYSPGEHIMPQSSVYTGAVEGCDNYERREDYPENVHICKNCDVSKFEH